MLVPPDRYLPSKDAFHVGPSSARHGGTNTAGCVSGKLSDCFRRIMSHFCNTLLDQFLRFRRAVHSSCSLARLSFVLTQLLYVGIRLPFPGRTSSMPPVHYYVQSICTLISIVLFTVLCWSRLSVPALVHTVTTNPKELEASHNSFPYIQPRPLRMGQRTCLASAVLDVLPGFPVSNHLRSRGVVLFEEGKPATKARSLILVSRSRAHVVRGNIPGVGLLAFLVFGHGDDV